MAHPSREAWALELAAETGAEVVWDEKQSAWDTGKRALLSGDGSHVLVLQDDVILSPSLADVVRSMVEHSGNHPICLYSQRTSKMAAVERIRTNQPWFLGQGPHYGPGVVIPTAHVPGLVKYGDRTNAASYDGRLWRFYQGEQIDCLYTYPSLIDHRIGHGSLMGKGKDRPAYNFGSGVGLDWSIPPLKADNRTLYPKVTMQKGSLEKEVRYGTAAWKRAVRLGFQEKTPRRGFSP